MRPHLRGCEASMAGVQRCDKQGKMRRLFAVEGAIGDSTSVSVDSGVLCGGLSQMLRGCRAAINAPPWWPP